MQRLFDDHPTTERSQIGAKLVESFGKLLGRLFGSILYAAVVVLFWVIVFFAFYVIEVTVRGF